MLVEWTRRYPLLLPCLALLLGIMLGDRLVLASPLYLMALMFSSSVGLLLWRGRRALLLLFLFFLAFGWWRMLSLKPSNTVQGERDVTFRIAEYPQCDNVQCRFRVEVSEGFSVQLRVRGGELAVIPGEVYRGRLLLQAPRTFRNPESFDYSTYLRRQGIATTAYVKNFATLQKLAVAPWIDRQAGKFRQYLREIFVAALPEGKEREVLLALFLGEHGIRDETNDDFRRTGLTHVLVVSGLHFTFIFLFFYYPVYLLFSFRPAWADRGWAHCFAFATALLPTFFYGLLVGLTPSVLRALAFVGLMFIALVKRWRKDFTASLLLIALLILVYRPGYLFSLSFQLSFFSVTAIYYFGLVFHRALQAWSLRRAWLRQVWLHWGVTTFYSSLVVNIVLFPILAVSFHEVSLVAPIANLLAIPFFTCLILPAELLSATLGILHASWASWLLKFCAQLLSYFLSLLSIVAKYSWTTLLVGKLVYWDYLSYFFILLALLSWLRLRLLLFMLSMALVCYLGGQCQIGTQTHPHLQLTMLDVGQGDSLFLSLPSGETLVIDGGGFPYSDFDVGRNIVLPELLGKDLRYLDAVVLTHPDADHWKGLSYLLKRFRVNEFWTGSGTPEQPAFVSLKKQLQQHSIPLRVLSQGAQWNYQGVNFEVLWPPHFDARQILTDNDLSLVLRIRYGEVCFLLTGDIEAIAETEIAKTLEACPLSLLKVAHHGSATSSTDVFLEAAKPSFALISLGEGNRYHFPHSDVLTRLEQMGITVLRSDHQGQIEVETDGQDIFYRRFTDGLAPNQWFSTRGGVFD